MTMTRTISFTKREAAFASITVSLVLAATVSIGAGCAFAFCVFVVLTA